MAFALKAYEFYDYALPREEPTKPLGEKSHFVLEVVDAELELSHLTPLPIEYSLYTESVILDDFVMTSSTTPLQIFSTVTMPIIIAIVGAAWVLFTRLDDAIDATRTEALSSVQQLATDHGKRFDYFEQKLDGISDKIEKNSSHMIKELYELRHRQAITEHQNR